MKLTEIFQQVSDLTKAPEEKQKEISVAEVWHLSQHLQMRYDVLETTNILKNYAQSPDLDLILNLGAKVLRSQIKNLEDLLQEYRIPLNVRPAFDVNSTANIEMVTDRYIFRRVLRGIQAFIPLHGTAYIQCTLPKIREHFRTSLMAEIDLYDKFFEYGKLRGYENIPPKYTH